MSRSFITHLVSVVLSLVLVCSLLFLIKSQKDNEPIEQIILSGDQTRTRGVLSNLTGGEQDELQLAASLQNPKQITILGSSEFNDSPYAAYHFLPDTIGLATMGVGHAHHQCFSILCELMAMHDRLNNAKICIVLSPSWFHTPGTNTEAFIEFVRPNFLKKIAGDQQMQPKFKAVIGKYIADHAKDFTSINTTMQTLMDYHELQNTQGINTLLAQLREFMKSLHPDTYAVPEVRYEVKSLTTISETNWSTDENTYLQNLQQKFINSITTNKLYIEDYYYTEIVLQEDSTERIDTIAELSFDNNNEWDDFKLLVEFLDQYNANCSFVMQPMNPYFYEHTERNLPLIDSVKYVLDQHQMPLLNLYTVGKTTYQPGVLKDAMHLGEVGWMKINFFLDSLYHE